MDLTPLTELIDRQGRELRQLAEAAAVVAIAGGRTLRWAMTEERTFGMWLRRQLASRQGPDGRALSPTAFARMAGVSHTMVSKWLSGNVLPSPESCDKIAGALGVDVDDVLSLAGHRRAVNDGADPLIRAVVGLMRQLPDDHKYEVVEYARWQRDRARKAAR